MKKLSSGDIVVVLAISIFIAVCSYTVWLASRTYFGKVDQDVSVFLDGDVVRTHVWYKKEIVMGWYDPIETITDSIINLRQRQGDSLLQTLKKMR